MIFFNEEKNNNKVSSINNYKNIDNSLKNGNNYNNNYDSSNIDDLNKDILKDVNSIVNSGLKSYLDNEINNKFKNPIIINYIDFVSDISLTLADNLQLDYNICYTASSYFKMNLLNNNYSNIFNTIVSDQNLKRWISDDYINIIASACKECDEHKKESAPYFTSLYSKVLYDANFISDYLDINYVIYNIWNKIFDENKDKNDITIFSLFCNEVLDYYKNIDINKLFIDISKKILLNKIEIISNFVSNKNNLSNLLIKLLNLDNNGINIHNDKTFFKIENIDDDNNKNSFIYKSLDNGVYDNFDNLSEDIFLDLSDIKKNSKIINEDNSTNKLSKRKQIENLIYKFMSIVDPTDANTKKYKDFFSKMSDTKFNNYMKDFLNDDSKNFYMEIVPNENEPSLELIKKGLDLLKVPAEEYVYFRNENHEDNPIRSKNKVPVGWLTIKRLQQLLSKKNTYSLSVNQRNAKTGQATGDSKIARISDIESYSLVAQGADYALQEFLGPRADSQSKKLDLYKNINTYGYSYIKDLKPDIMENQTLNTIHTYLLGCGLNNDLLEENKTDLENTSNKESS